MGRARASAPQAELSPEDAGRAPGRSAPRTPQRERSAAALPGRRPRPAAPRQRRDLPRPAPGSRPPAAGGRGAGRRPPDSLLARLASPAGAALGSPVTDERASLSRRCRRRAASRGRIAAPSSWIHLLPLHLLPLPSPGEARAACVLSCLAPSLEPAGARGAEAGAASWLSRVWSNPPQHQEPPKTQARRQPFRLLQIPEG